MLPLSLRLQVKVFYNNNSTGNSCKRIISFTSIYSFIGANFLVFTFRNLRAVIKNPNQLVSLEAHKDLIQVSKETLRIYLEIERNVKEIEP